MPISVTGPCGQHTGGSNAAFADGMIQFLKFSLYPPIFQTIVTCDGGEVITSSPF